MFPSPFKLVSAAAATNLGRPLNFEGAEPLHGSHRWVATNLVMEADSDTHISGVGNSGSGGARDVFLIVRVRGLSLAFACSAAISRSSEAPPLLSIS